MQFSKDITPVNSLYFLGGVVINILQNFEETEIDFFDILDSLRREYSVSIPLFVQVLDWLFLLGLIKDGYNGRVVKCF